MFKYDNLVVIIDPFNRKKYEFVNAEVDEFREFYKAHCNDIWIAYNGNNYDKYITQGKCCTHVNLKDLNDFIVVKGNRGYHYSDSLQYFPLLTFDVMATNDGGLKTLEAFMGNDIRETSVPFDINRRLTEDEIKKTLEYCTHDVEQLIEVFLRRKVEFDAQLALCKMFKKPISYIAKSQAQLAAAILGARRVETYDEWKIRMPETLRLEKYKFIEDWFLNPLNHSEKASLKCDIAGVPHTVAWGGIHGAVKKYNYTCAPDELMVMADVSQLYPCLMWRYRLLSRGCPESAYKTLRNTIDTSIRLKTEGKKKEREPYKRFNNIIYGAEGDKYNPMYDPLHRKLVCVFGQVLIVDLIEKVESFCELIQSNTDGVLFKIKRKDFERLDDAVFEWEQRTGLNMTFDLFEKIYQGDVNNYLAVEYSGKYKSKGAYVKPLSDLDNDLPIVNKAIVEYLVNGVHPERTISECDDLMQFQKVVKVSSKYAFAVLCPTTETLVRTDLFGKQSSETVFETTRLQDKTFRVFASTRPHDGFIGKCKKEDSKPEKFANTPEKCFIWNESVLGVKCPDYLDKQWYITLAKNRIYEKFGLTV